MLSPDAEVIRPQLPHSGRGTTRVTRERDDAMTTTDGEEHGGTFL